jgi:carboxyl-terminal processing protease
MPRAPIRARLAPLAVLGLSACLAWPSATAAGSDLAPEPHHPLVAHSVGGALSGFHYAARPIDDELARLWLDAWVDDLDPLRLFFLESDLEDFRRRATELDDDIQSTSPELDAAFDVIRRYRLRAKEAYETAETLLDEEMTFDDPSATVELDRTDAPWPTTAEARTAVWRDRVRAQMLDMLLSGETPEKAKEILRKRFERRLGYIQDQEAPDVIEGYLSALASVYDPHSSYFKPATREDFDIRMRDALEGIGAELRQEDAYTKVVRLIPGGPAEQGSELQPGDLIVKVAQGDEEPVDVVDMRLDHVVRLIRGKKGTEVRLTVRPADADDPSETRVVAITRDKVILEQASAKAELREVEGPGGSVLKVGVIEVPSFYVDAQAMRRGDPQARSTTRDVERLVGELREQGAEALVIDLRGNGGGALSEAIETTGLFIDRGPVVQVNDPNRGVEVLEDEDKGVVWAGPLVVLTDELSASASEIFAGAIQDYRRGLVVGAPQTHGKGSVQQVMDLGAMLSRYRVPGIRDKAGALKLTLQMFYRVSGESTQTRGVVPDVVLPSPWEGIDVLESDLDRHLPWGRIRPADYAALPMDVDLAALRSASSARVASEPVFGWLDEDVAERMEREASDRISLHRPTREAEREEAEKEGRARLEALGIDPDAAEAEDEADSEGSEAGEDEGPGDLDEAVDDVVLTEALRIAADFTAQWTAPPELSAADSRPTSSETKRKGRVQRNRR